MREYGIQMYSVRDITEKDMPGALRALAEMGYKNVEFAGFFGIQAEEIKKLLDDNGNLSLSKAAVFCAMDYLDEYRKSAGSAENMRSQIQDYIADAAKAKLAEDKVRAENEVLQRENAALREQLAKLQAKMKETAAREQAAKAEAGN